MVGASSRAWRSARRVHDRRWRSWPQAGASLVPLPIEQTLRCTPGGGLRAGVGALGGIAEQRARSFRPLGCANRLGVHSPGTQSRWNRATCPAPAGNAHRAPTSGSYVGVAS